ncbi:hypothetical protein EVAR_18113_1 [Eumeta japonica]|uniref:Uncharacterized protein n=1 Tax=Eumeta variegata TaxID=151549 RepID=A0A4C1VHV4_EUMVA|nr:hypothetical protein EVAR_18113_1 [Eumeta japonica]
MTLSHAVMPPLSRRPLPSYACMARKMVIIIILYIYIHVINDIAQCKLSVMPIDLFIEYQLISNNTISLIIKTALSEEGLRMTPGRDRERERARGRDRERGRAGHTFARNPDPTSVFDSVSVSFRSWSSLRFSSDQILFSSWSQNSLPHPGFNPDFATSHDSDLDEVGSMRRSKSKNEENEPREDRSGSVFVSRGHVESESTPKPLVTHAVGGGADAHRAGP